MKLPRGISGGQLIRTLEGLGYRTVRPSGSHVRLHCNSPVEHSVTVPLHDSVKVGTLHSIIKEVASARGIHPDRLIQKLISLNG